MATVGGLHICSPPPIRHRWDEIGSLWTCSCGLRYVREEIYAKDGTWLTGAFDLSPDSDPMPPFDLKIKLGRRM